MDDCIESDIVFKWTNCCRLCLSSEVKIDIFQTESVFSDISTKLNTFLNSLIYRGDPMPRKLCQSCVTQLDSWQSFRKQCQETENDLKKRLHPYRALDFVENFFKKDAAFHASQQANTAQGGRIGDGSIAAASTNLESCPSVEESHLTCLEHADSTNLFVGVPIKLEPLDDLSMSDCVRNEEDKSLPAAEDGLDPDVYNNFEGSTDGSCGESISEGPRSCEGQSGNVFAKSIPKVENELNIGSNRDFGDSTEGSSPESSSEGQQNDGDGQSNDGLAILRHMADVVGEASEKDKMPILEVSISESGKPILPAGVDEPLPSPMEVDASLKDATGEGVAVTERMPDSVDIDETSVEDGPEKDAAVNHPTPSSMEVDEMSLKDVPEKAGALYEPIPDSVEILKNILLVAEKEARSERKVEEKKVEGMTLNWRTGELETWSREEPDVSEKTTLQTHDKLEPETTESDVEMALNWKTGELEAVKKASQKIERGLVGNAHSTENGVVYNLKVKTDLGQQAIAEPTKGGNIAVGITHREAVAAQWEKTPGHITSVKGSANAVWLSQPSMSSPWSDHIHDMLEFKQEPLSPSREGNDLEADSRDISYNLRPRLEAVVHYGEVEDWLEEVDTPPPRPARQRVTPWKCIPCQLYFTSSSAVQAHQATQQCLGMKMDSFSCQMCLKKFFSENDMAEHNLVHLKVAYNVTADDLSSCMKCDLSFADPVRFKQHKGMHALKKMPSQATQYPCSECGLVFIKKTIYESHLIGHRTPARALRPPGRVTPVVVSTFNDPGNYKTPMPATNTTERDFACSLCIERFKSEDLLYDHRFAFHGIPDERVACSTCSIKFRGPAALEEHMKISHPSRSVARKTTKPSLAVSHAKPITPLPAGSVRCRRCGLVFASQQELMQHEISKHKNPSPFWCRTCRQRFPTRSLLLIHHRTHSGVTISPQPELSDERSQSPNVVSGAPIETAPKVKQKEEMACKSCVITFRVEADLEQHKAAHVKFGSFTTSRFRHLPGHIYRYQCSGCPQMFSAKESLSRHLVHVHSGEDLKFQELIFPAKRTDSVTSVECKLCHLKVSSQAGLNFHMRKQHEFPEKNNKVLEQGSESCPYCPRKFAASYIQRHINYQHGGRGGGKSASGDAPARKPLQCRHCPRVCNTKYNLRRHEHAHSSRDRPDWICVCGKNFIYRYKEKYLKHRRYCYKNTKKGMSEDIGEAPPTPPKSAPLQSTPLEPCNSGHNACSVCLNSYETQSLLELHTMTAHGLALFGEDGGGRERELWREEANKIVRKVDGEHRCTLCRVQFESVEAAAWHRAQHPRGNLYVVQIDDSLYQCTVCDQLFDGREVALQHAAQHADDDIKPSPAELGPQTFNCPFCSSTFTSEDSIRSHIFYVHPGGSANTI